MRLGQQQQHRTYPRDDDGGWDPGVAIVAIFLAFGGFCLLLLTAALVVCVWEKWCRGYFHETMGLRMAKKPGSQV